MKRKISHEKISGKGCKRNFYNHKFSQISCVLPGERVKPPNDTLERSQDAHTHARTHAHTHTHTGRDSDLQPRIEPRTFLPWAKHVKRTYFGQTAAEQQQQHQQQQRQQLGYIHSVGLLLEWNSLRSDCATRLCAPPVKAPRQSDRALPHTQPPTYLPPSLPRLAHS